MQIKASYLAVNGEGVLVRAEQAILQFWKCYRCHHCGCPVSVHPAAALRKAHFMHASVEITPERIARCAYLEENAKAQARLQPFRQLVEAVEPVVTVQRWECVMCCVCFDGHKTCPSCQNGIYSRALPAPSTPALE